MSTEILQNSPENTTKLTTCYEEPWHLRGEGNSGRKPPYFAYYTKVYCKDTTNISKIIHNLKNLTVKTSAHYLWYDNATKSIEIWAHPLLINNIANTITEFIEKCDILQSNEYFMTSVKCDNLLTNIGLLIANFKYLINKPLHIWYNNNTKAVDIWTNNINSLEKITHEINELINNCSRSSTLSLNDFI